MQGGCIASDLLVEILSTKSPADYIQITTMTVKKLTPKFNMSRYTFTYCTKTSPLSLQTLPGISLPQHMSSCLVLEDSACACTSLMGSSWLPQAASSSPARALLGSV